MTKYYKDDKYVSDTTTHALYTLYEDMHTIRVLHSMGYDRDYIRLSGYTDDLIDKALYTTCSNTERT